MAGEIKVGDKFFAFDTNRRKYLPAVNGVPSRGPIYRDHFYDVQVMGETSRSWVIGREGYAGALNEIFKVPKGKPFEIRTGDYASRIGIFTQKMMDDECYVHEHRHKIAYILGNLRDADKLREVAALLGYAPEMEKVV